MSSSQLMVMPPEVQKALKVSSQSYVLLLQYFKRSFYPEYQNKSKESMNLFRILYGLGNILCLKGIRPVQLWVDFIAIAWDTL